MKTQFKVKFDLETDGVQGTTIDLFWDHPFNHAVFLDGPHHNQLHQANIDEFVTEALEKRGITVQRIPYDPPRSRHEKRLVYSWICDEIEAALRFIEGKRKTETDRLNGRSKNEIHSW